MFYFVYDFPSRKLTHLDDGKKEQERMDWASVSPDGQTVVYAKDCNLFRMSMADYRKAQKDEKDSTIVEVQLTDDGTPDFGYGIPYSMLNTDTLCNGKRRWVYGCWSPDSRHFVTIVSDDRSVKPLWVINALADPRPTLETYKYQMPGEMTAPEEHLYLFDMTANTRREIRTAAWKTSRSHWNTVRRSRKNATVSGILPYGRAITTASSWLGAAATCTASISVHTRWDRIRWCL